MDVMEGSLIMPYNGQQKMDYNQQNYTPIKQLRVNASTKLDQTSLMVVRLLMVPICKVQLQIIQFLSWLMPQIGVHTNQEFLTIVEES